MLPIGLLGSVSLATGYGRSTPASADVHADDADDGATYDGGGHAHDFSWWLP